MIDAFGSTNGTATAGWHPDPDTRGTWTIVVSCVITLALSAWTALHLNVPEQGRRGLRWKKAKWLGLGLIAPEAVAYVAWCQRREAKRLARDVRQALHQPEPERLWTRLRRRVICGRRKKQQHTDEANASSSPIGQPVNAIRNDIPIWTTVHGFYGTMGGFAMSTGAGTGATFLPNDRTRATLTPQGLLFVLEQAPALFPITSRADIRDKSKADGVKKTVICMQAIWFGVNVVTRLAQGLPIALLELNAAAHAICTLVIYAMWWDKPLDVEEPTLLGESKVEASDELLAFMWMASRCSTCGLRSWDLRHRLRDEFDGIWMLGGVHIEDLIFEQQRGAGAVRGADSPDVDADLTATASGTPLSISSPQPRESPILYTPPNQIESSHDFASKVVTFLYSHSSRVRLHAPAALFSRRTAISALSSATIERWKLAHNAIHKYSLSSLLRERHGTRVPFLHDRDYLKLRIPDYGAVLTASSGGYLVAWLAGGTSGLLYGGLHCLAWNAPFVTKVEAILWRISSVMITGVAGVLAPSVLAFPDTARGLSKVADLVRRQEKGGGLDSMSSGRGDMKLSSVKQWVLVFLWILVIWLLGPFLHYGYLGSRVFLIVESFVNLRYLPHQVYVDVRWPGYLPHIN